MLNKLASGAYTSGDPYRQSPSIKYSCGGMTNAVAYHDVVLIVTVKSFIAQDPVSRVFRANAIECFFIQKFNLFAQDELDW